MDFRILGPLEVHVNGKAMPMGRRRERCLLGLLLLEPGHAIPADRLISLLWEEPDPPANAHRLLHSHIARLRRLLAALPEPPALVASGSGYAVQVAPETVDAQRFRTMVSEAKRCATSRARAELLGAALRLWRGPVLDGTASASLRARVCRDLEELRLLANEDWLAAELELGHHRERVADLAALAAEHPERERGLGLYMLALDRCGRTSDALQAYDTRRRWLAEHQGLDPGPELREIHAAILRGTATPVVAKAGPAQLPPETATFVGRRAELGLLDGFAAEHGRTVNLVVVTGMGGVGKTALALRWAHRVAAEFPGGQLYFDLRGYDRGEPVDVLRVVGAFLRALGVAPAQIPANVDEATALYRTMSAGRRLLLLLDNAGGADQVRALLPSGPALVLVTSRDRLLGLAARDDARMVELDALPPDDAVRLLEAMIGAGRVAREPLAAATVAAGCGRLPLALRIAGAELLARPGGELTDYLAEIRDGTRLSRLTIDGDQRSAVRSVLQRSHQRLDPAAARLFGMLAAIPGADFDGDTAAAAGGLSPGAASALLTRLTNANMLNETGPDRYAMHELVRDYARELGHGDTTAVQRVYAYFTGRAAAAAERIDPDALRLPGEPEPAFANALRLPGAAEPEPAFADAGAARDWIDRELANIIAVIQHAADHGPDPAAWRIADALRRHLWQRGNAIEALAVAVPAARAAQAAGDRHAIAAMTYSLGQAEEHAGQYQEAVEHVQAAADTARAAGWVRGEAAALVELGDIEIQLGRLKEAIAYFESALVLFRQIGHIAGEADCSNGLGGVALQLGRPEEAGGHYRAALAHYEAIGATGAAAVALANLGEVSLDLGRLDDAIRYHSKALELYSQVGRDDGTAFSLVRLATAHAEAGRYAEALDRAVEGLDVIDRTDLLYHRVPALGALGTVARCRDDLPLALRYHDEAVHSARELGLQFLVADALIALGTTQLAAGRRAEARAAAAEAMRLADEGSYQLLASQSRTLLANADGAGETAIGWAEQALDLARAGGFRLAEAQALQALALAHEPPDRRLLAQARDLFTDLGSAAADRVRAML